ncbi:UNVERIFIED_CONTAM: NLI interacting factor family phosphatase [Hammondia hammondi]|eukprot:XP_008884543.1 NLI interacting factor family phosphatase [Hammondia hammondi]
MATEGVDLSDSAGEERGATAFEDDFLESLKSLSDVYSAQQRNCYIQGETGDLPPAPSDSKRTVFLDIDETLVHVTPYPLPFVKPDATFLLQESRRPSDPPGVSPEYLPGVSAGAAPRAALLHVYYRPFLMPFLENLLQTNRCELVAFTAALREYADPILDGIEAKLGGVRGSVFAGRLYRQHCARAPRSPLVPPPFLEDSHADFHSAEGFEAAETGDQTEENPPETERDEERWQKRGEDAGEAGEEDRKEERDTVEGSKGGKRKQAESDVGGRKRKATTDDLAPGDSGEAERVNAGLSENPPQEEGEEREEGEAREAGEGEREVGNTVAERDELAGPGETCEVSRLSGCERRPDAETTGVGAPTVPLPLSPTSFDFRRALTESDHDEDDLYNQQLVEAEEFLYVKDLVHAAPSRCLSRCVLLDNSVVSLAAQLANGLLLRPFYGDPQDRELEGVLAFLLDLLEKTGDIRESMKESGMLHKVTQMLLLLPELRESLALSTPLKAELDRYLGEGRESAEAMASAADSELEEGDAEAIAAETEREGSERGDSDEKETGTVRRRSRGRRIRRQTQSEGVTRNRRGEGGKRERALGQTGVKGRERACASASDNSIHEQDLEEDDLHESESLSPFFADHEAPSSSSLSRASSPESIDVTRVVDALSAFPLLSKPHDDETCRSTEPPSTQVALESPASVSSPPSLPASFLLASTPPASPSRARDPPPAAGAAEERGSFDCVCGCPSERGIRCCGEENLPAESDRLLEKADGECTRRCGEEGEVREVAGPEHCSVAGGRRDCSTQREEIGDARECTFAASGWPHPRLPVLLASAGNEGACRGQGEDAGGEETSEAKKALELSKAALVEGGCKSVHASEEEKEDEQVEGSRAHVEAAFLPESFYLSQGAGAGDAADPLRDAPAVSESSWPSYESLQIWPARGEATDSRSGTFLEENPSVLSVALSYVDPRPPGEDRLQSDDGEIPNVCPPALGSSSSVVHGEALSLSRVSGGFPSGPSYPGTSRLHPEERDPGRPSGRPALPHLAMPPSSPPSSSHLTSLAPPVPFSLPVPPPSSPSTPSASSLPRPERFRAARQFTFHLQEPTPQGSRPRQHIRGLGGLRGFNCEGAGVPFAAQGASYSPSSTSSEYPNPSLPPPALAGGAAQLGAREAAEEGMQETQGAQGARPERGARLAERRSEGKETRRAAASARKSQPEPRVPGHPQAEQSETGNSSVSSLRPLASCSPSSVSSLVSSTSSAPRPSRLAAQARPTQVNGGAFSEAQGAKGSTRLSPESLCQSPMPSALVRAAPRAPTGSKKGPGKANHEPETQRDRATQGSGQDKNEGGDAPAPSKSAANPQSSANQQSAKDASSAPGRSVGQVLTRQKPHAARASSLPAKSSPKPTQLRQETPRKNAEGRGAPQTEVKKRITPSTWREERAQLSGREDLRRPVTTVQGPHSRPAGVCVAAPKAIRGGSGCCGTAGSLGGSASSPGLRASGGKKSKKALESQVSPRKGWCERLTASLGCQSAIVHSGGSTPTQGTSALSTPCSVSPQPQGFHACSQSSGRVFLPVSSATGLPGTQSADTLSVSPVSRSEARQVVSHLEAPSPHTPGAATVHSKSAGPRVNSTESPISQVVCRQYGGVTNGTQGNSYVLACVSQGPPNVSSAPRALPVTGALPASGAPQWSLGAGAEAQRDRSASSSEVLLWHNESEERQYSAQSRVRSSEGREDEEGETREVEVYFAAPQVPSCVDSAAIAVPRHARETGVESVTKNVDNEEPSLPSKFTSCEAVPVASSCAMAAASTPTQRPVAPQSSPGSSGGFSPASSRVSLVSCSSPAAAQGGSPSFAAALSPRFVQPVLFVGGKTNSMAFGSLISVPGARELKRDFIPSSGGQETPIGMLRVSSSSAGGKPPAFGPSPLSPTSRTDASVVAPASTLMFYPVSPRPQAQTGVSPSPLGAGASGAKNSDFYRPPSSTNPPVAGAVCAPQAVPWQAEMSPVTARNSPMSVNPEAAMNRLPSGAADLNPSDHYRANSMPRTYTPACAPLSPSPLSSVACGPSTDRLVWATPSRGVCSVAEAAVLGASSRVSLPPVRLHTKNGPLSPSTPYEPVSEFPPSTVPPVPTWLLTQASGPRGRSPDTGGPVGSGVWRQLTPRGSRVWVPAERETSHSPIACSKPASLKVAAEEGPQPSWFCGAPRSAEALRWGGSKDNGTQGH